MTVKRSPVGNSEHDFEICDQIGSGGSGKVFKAKSLRDGYEGKYFALKKISKFRDNGHNCTEKIKKEIEIHSQLIHPSILKFYGSFESEEYWYLVLELCEKESLQEYIKRKKTLSEEEACKIVEQVIDGVKYLHSRNLIHRDLSLKNLLLTDNYEVKIADFGLAIKFNDKGRKADVVGTANFMAPEAFRGHYDFKTDCWSIGCILYALLYGKPPFDSDKRKNIQMRIQGSDLKFPDYASREAKELLVDMLQKEADKRIELKDALMYPFFQRYGKSSRTYKVPFKKNKDSGMSSLSGSSSSNTPFTQKKSSKKYFYDERILNDDYNSYNQPADQYDRSKMKRSCSSSQLTKGKSIVAVENHVSNKNVLPSCEGLYNSLSSSQINPDSRVYKPQEFKEINSQMHSFKYANGCITSTKIQDVQKHFSHSREHHAPESNFVHKSNYCQQFPAPLHKKTDSCHSYRTNEKENKRIQMKNITSDKSLRAKLPPTLFTTTRLPRRRHVFEKLFKTLSILNDGRVCLELLKSEENQTVVYQVCFFSRDGKQIKIFNAKENILLDGDEPPSLDKLKKPKTFTFKNLPERHWEKYQDAKHYVDRARAITAKVTVYENFGKCIMMENNPDPDFHMIFYNGFKIFEARHKITIQDQKGKNVEICNNTQSMLDQFEYMKKVCKDYEAYINSKNDSHFPAVFGREPATSSKSSKPKRQDVKENVNTGYMQSSLNGTVTSMKSNFSKLSINSPSLNSSQKSLPRPKSRDRSIATPCRNNAETMLDLEKCQLVGEKWVLTEYKDGIQMYISIEDAKHFFRDVKTQERLQDSQRPDLIDRFHRDSPRILCHVFSKQNRKKP